MPFVFCPVCTTAYYHGVLRVAGDRCGDLSHGQPAPCSGRCLSPLSAPGRRWLADHRFCFACRAEVPAQAGVYHADLGILTHQGRCAERVEAERRTTDRSARGRWRPGRVVLARVLGVSA
jgi:hypothetical protein